MKNFSERLKSARIMKRYSLQDLADALDNVVSKQALHKYEQGLMKPDQEMLVKLCNALDVRPDYFVRDTTVVLGNIEFRKQKQLSAKESSRIKEKTIDVLERYIEIEDLLGVDQIFVNPISDMEINTYADVEAAVKKLRAVWALGDDPLRNVVELLEDYAIKVIEIDSVLDFVGLATWENIKNPVIVVNSILAPDRKRFTVLHELGHILMNVNHHPEKEREFLCHSFAGAMLISDTLLIKELGPSRSEIYTNELICLKKKFGASIYAIMFRAKYLEIITEGCFKKYMLYFNKQGYRLEEPGEYIGYEKSNRFKQLIYRAVAEDIISTSKAAALDNKKLSEFRDELAQYST